jgi:hypothetical protein
MTQTCWKKTGLAILLTLMLLLAGCGNGSNGGTINGSWTAALTNTNGSEAFAFTTDFTQSSGNSLNIVNFSFTTSGSCFSSPTTETGSFVLSGDFNGKVTGQFQFTISTMFPLQNNVLTMQGTANGNTISGTWTLTGSTGCTGNGNFTMNRM